MDGGAWWAAVHGVAKSQTWLSDFTFTFPFPALEKEMATHSSVLAWRIPGMGEPGGLPSMGSHRVGHDWSDLAAAAAEIRMKNCEVRDCYCFLLNKLLWLFVFLLIKTGILFWKENLCFFAQSCLTLCDPSNCNLSGPSIHGISQARILEWIASSSSRGSSGPRNQSCVSCNSCIAGRFFTHFFKNK